MAFNYGVDPYETNQTTFSFVSQLDMLLQQKMSKLRGVCSTGQYVGKQAAVVNQIGVLSHTAPEGRYSDIVPQIAKYSRRWVFPNDRSLAVWVDQFDELRSIVDPKGGLAAAAAASANRYFDDLIINAANATATIGPDSSNFGTEPFATTASTSGGYLVVDTFGASASTGMTYPKLVETRRVMRHNQVDLDAEPAYVLMSSQQEADLLKQQEVINRDYNGGGMAVENGAVTKVAGFTPIFSERVNTSSSSTLRNCLAFVPSGLHLGIWRDTTVKIDNRIDKESQPWQLYSVVTAGATRTQLFKIVQVNCADTSGTDPTAP